MKDLCGHYFREPDPHESEKLDPDPHLSRNSGDLQAQDLDSIRSAYPDPDPGGQK